MFVDFSSKNTSFQTKCLYWASFPVATVATLNIVANSLRKCLPQLTEFLVLKRYLRWRLKQQTFHTSLQIFLCVSRRNPAHSCAPSAEI